MTGDPPGPPSTIVASSATDTAPDRAGDIDPGPGPAPADPATGSAVETAPAPSATPGALAGIGLMLASTVLIALMHVLIRQVSATIHPFEIAFFRSLFALGVVLPWFVRQGLAPLRTRHLGLHGLRALFNIVAMLAFFYALAITPLAEVTALAFTAPIFATLLAALLLGEVMRLRRWSAIGVGFLGTLIILRPGFEEIGVGQLLTVLSSLAWACALIIIKTLGRTDSSVTIITYMALMMIPLALVPAAFVWVWPNPNELLWLILIGLLGGGGQYCISESLRRAEVAVVMPVDFCKLLWVSALAYLAFGERPDLFTWLGGTVVFASTVYIAYREQLRTRTRDAPIR